MALDSVGDSDEALVRQLLAWEGPPAEWRGTPAEPWRPTGCRSKGWATKGQRRSLCGEYVYDAYKADRVIRWIEHHCVHTIGQLQGQPVRMMRHHRRRVRKIFGWLHAQGEAAGTRKHRTFFGGEPRGNAKTTFLAWIALVLLLADGEPAAFIFSIASDESEARLIFEEAGRIVRLSPRLRDELEVLEKVIFHGPTGSAFRPLPDKKKGHHGLNPHGVLGDEVHTWTNRNQYEAARSARSKRKQAFQGYTTTAGTDRTSLCFDLWTKALDIKAGKIYAPDWLVDIRAAPDEADWTDPWVWFYCNPALWDRVKNYQTVVEEFVEALKSPAGEAAFRQLHLNQWAERSIRWLSAIDFDRSGLEARRMDLTPAAALEALAGCECIAGLDLAMVRDLSSMFRIFAAPNALSETLPVVVWDHWVDQGTMKDRVKRDKVPYTDWWSDGWLRTTPGNATDFGQMFEDIADIHRQTPIRRLGFDPAFARDLVQRIERDLGVQCEKVPQSMGILSQPSAEFERMIIEQAFIHLDDPVARWSVGNVAVHRLGDGKFKPDKQVSTERIDPISAAVTGLRLYLDIGEIMKESVYEHRGIRSV